MPATMWIDPLEKRHLLAVLPAGFSDASVTGGLNHPVALDIAPDGRAFVTEQGGTVRVVRDGTLLPTPFVTVDVNSAGERGVLGITLDPQFETNHFVYVYYTANTPNLHNRISRFTAAGDVAVPGSETILFELDRLDSDASVHNGGAIHFGAGGKLYIAAGENASPERAQSLTTTHGKVLRINADGSIPTDNPFYNDTSGNNRAIWALGFRNPFTFDIERGTGRTFINDVGAATWEEIDAATAGANFGWPREEGPGPNAAYQDPLYAYHHDQGDPTGCAIVGGTFYDPPGGAGAPGAFPAEYEGDYFFADGCETWIWRLDRETNTASPFATDIGPGFGLTTAADGSLYYVTYSQGQVRKVSYASPAAPVIVNAPAAQSVAEGRPATFAVNAFGQEPLTYQWQRDGVDIPGATGSSYTIETATAADNGASFAVLVSNALGSVTSPPAMLTVVTDAPPVPVINAPREGVLYTAGRRLRFSGAATDPEDGRLRASAFSWRIDFHHDEHSHPFVPETIGRRAGRVRIPATGETSANVWYRVHLTVADSAGVSTTTFRDVRPRTSTVTVQTNIPGLQVHLDGAPVAAPVSFTGVVGVRRLLEAPPTQTVDGVEYVFHGWGRKRRAAFELKTPGAGRTFTAVYEPAAAT